MKTFFFLLWCFTLPGLYAQVEVSTSLPANIFLKYEGIPLTMEIINRSGEKIVLKEEDSEDLILLRMRDLQNRAVPRTQKPVLAEPWIIENGETSTRTFDLAQLFTVHYAMSYRCLQDVKLAGESYTGIPKQFEVVNGLLEEKIKRRKQDRIFNLIGLHRGGRDELMMRITNYSETKVIATYYLERHLKHYDPHMKTDKNGKVATLHYLSPSRVVKCEFNPDGTPIGRTYYSASAGVAVRLYDQNDGGFVVQGAVELPGQGGERDASGE